MSSPRVLGRRLRLSISVRQLRFNGLGTTLTESIFCLVLACFSGGIVSAAESDSLEAKLERTENCVRIATLNTSLYRDSASLLVQELESGNSRHAQQVAALLQIVRPDVVLLNEIDYRNDQRAVRSFLEDYLSVSQRGPGGSMLPPLRLPYWFSGPVNTGIDSTLDLNRDGRLGTPDDAWGYGKYVGQYGMALLSRFPIDHSETRTFQKFLWSKLPDAQRPIMPDGTPFYPDEVWSKLRLSSKSHWDVPIRINDSVVHFLASHPTPPAFDGPEKRNVCRNHDEIRFWNLYIDSNQQLSFLQDDSGQSGGLPTKARFVILGDLNADPQDGSGRIKAIRSLLKHPLVQDPRPASKGAFESAGQLRGANLNHRGGSELDTSQFSERSVGNLRVDYCLPSKNLHVKNSGVFWPPASHELRELIQFTDHRLVWVDIELDSHKETP